MSAKQAVIITGGAKRVGAKLARYFSTQGYDIALHYNSSESQAQALKGDIERSGRSCVLLRQDLKDIGALPALVKKAYDAMPHVSALINNASVFEPSGLLETDEAFLDNQFTVNFKAPFFLTQAFAKTVGKGCVVNILDTHITRREGSHFAYLLSKKTLADFTLMAARALGPGIRVNGVCPGTVLPNGEQDLQYMGTLEKTVPLRALASAEDVAAAALFLCNQAHVTGQVIFADGGQHLL